MFYTGVQGSNRPSALFALLKLLLWCPGREDFTVIGSDEGKIFWWGGGGSMSCEIHVAITSFPQQSEG